MPPPPSTKHNKEQPLTQRLLLRAHCPTTAATIHASKFAHKPLRLLATDSKPHTTATTTTLDARTLRRQQRLFAAAASREQRRKIGKGRGPNSAGKPKPLSAAEKRKLGVYEIPKAERKQWDVYVGLNRMWVGYVREILGVGEGARGGTHVVPQNAGAVLASADFHGAEVEVVRCRCVGRVGVRGIVVRDTKFTFVVVTREGELKTLPKEHTIFRFSVPLTSTATEDVAKDEESSAEASDGHLSTITIINEQSPKSLVFELHGEQFKNRAAPDRAKKQFKMHLPPDL